MSQERKTLLALLLVALSALPCIGVFAFIFGDAIVNDVRVRAAFRVYPGAELVSTASTGDCCDSALKVFYYWTPDAISPIKTYYATFTLPFIDNKTMYQPFGGELKLGFIPSPTTAADEIDLRVDRTCHFSQKFSCVQIQLVGFDADNDVNLPEEFFSIATPSPLGESLRGGTLIIYGYYVETDGNLLL